MRTMRLFWLELKRLLQSRLTWLIVLLTVLSPMVGLTLYRPATASTMLTHVPGQSRHRRTAWWEAFCLACSPSLSWTVPPAAGWRL